MQVGDVNGLNTFCLNAMRDSRPRNTLGKRVTARKVRALLKIKFGEYPELQLGGTATQSLPVIRHF